MVLLVVKGKNWQNIRESQNMIKVIILKNVILLSMSLLTVPIVKSSHIYARIYFIFLKHLLKQT